MPGINFPDQVLSLLHLELKLMYTAHVQRSSTFQGQNAEKVHCYILLQASCGQVEVVGTPHATNGVRRLVKSVVRGLKACQVSASRVLRECTSMALPAAPLPCPRLQCTCSKPSRYTDHKLVCPLCNQSCRPVPQSRCCPATQKGLKLIIQHPGY